MPKNHGHSKPQSQRSKWPSNGAVCVHPDCSYVERIIADSSGGYGSDPPRIIAKQVTRPSDGAVFWTLDYNRSREAIVSWWHGKERNVGRKGGYCGDNFTGMKSRLSRNAATLIYYERDGILYEDNYRTKSA